MSGEVAANKTDEEVREKNDSIARRNVEMKILGKLEWNIISLKRMILKEKTGLKRLVMFEDLLDEIEDLNMNLITLYNVNMDLLIARERINDMLDDYVI